MIIELSAGTRARSSAVSYVWLMRMLKSLPHCSKDLIAHLLCLTPISVAVPFTANSYLQSSQQPIKFYNLSYTIWIAIYRVAIN